MPAIITGGGGAGFVVPDSATIPFADNAARDAWATANLGDLVQNLTVVEVTGSPNNVWYLWRGASNPASYVNTNWIDATPLVRGATGATGATGAAGADGADGAGVDFTGANDGDMLIYDAGAGTTRPAPVRRNPTTGLIETTVNTIFNPALNIGAVQLLATANILRLKGGGGTFIPLGSMITAAGTGEPLCPSLAAFDDLPAAIQQTNTTETLQLTPGQSMTYSQLIPAGIAHVVTQIDVTTVESGTLRLEVFEDNTFAADKKLLDETSAVGAGTTTVDYDGWAFYETGETVYIRYTNAGAANITLRGLTISGSFIPANTLRGHAYSVDTLASKFPSMGTDDDAIHDNEAGEINAIAAKATPVDADVVLIEDSAASFAKKKATIAAIRGALTPGAAVPSLHNFSINIPSRVDIGTNLNTQWTISFDVSNYSLLSAMELIVTDGDNVDLTLPIRDGVQTQTVDVTGTVTTAATTVTFQMSGTYAGGTVTSEIVTITVANVQAQEQAYVGALGSNTFATVDVSTLTAFDVTQAGTVYNIAQLVQQTEILGILSPTNRDPISLINVLGIDDLARFTAATDVRTIGGLSYNLLTLTNQGQVATFRYVATTE